MQPIGGRSWQLIYKLNRAPYDDINDNRMRHEKDLKILQGIMTLNTATLNITIFAITTLSITMLDAIILSFTTLRIITPIVLTLRMIIIRLTMLSIMAHRRMTIGTVIHSIMTKSILHCNTLALH